MVLIQFDISSNGIVTSPYHKAYSSIIELITSILGEDYADFEESLRPKNNAGDSKIDDKVLNALRPGFISTKSAAAKADVTLPAGADQNDPAYHKRGAAAETVDEASQGDDPRYHQPGADMETLPLSDPGDRAILKATKAANSSKMESGLPSPTENAHDRSKFRERFQTHT